ncbi:hypothetical protein ACI3MC_03195 (plasmid) [Klebsiella pneumoniae]|uniref:hypothetical protein n=1 Tax=Klebsiella pneumoniae TaxID=573 RepID=UPI003860143E
MRFEQQRYGQTTEKEPEKTAEFWYRNGNAHYLMVTGSMGLGERRVGGRGGVTGIMAIFCDFSTRESFLTEITGYAVM